MSDTPSGCGCPPTGATTGGVHHVIVNVTDLAGTREFWSWLMPRLGYPATMEMGGDALGFLGAAGSFWVKQATVRGDPFHKDRVGLCEIAFRAGSRDHVDALHRDLVARGVPIVDPPREYPEYVPGYYAVFFTDPDGMKLELVHIPG